MSYLKVIGLIFLALPLHAKSNKLPNEIAGAFKEVHLVAKHSHVKNLFMFNYTYYADGFCRDKDCSDTVIKNQTSLTRAKMGDDFEKYQLFRNEYKTAWTYLQSHISPPDMYTITGMRTAEQVMRSKTFVTCVDYTKAVLDSAIKRGFPEKDLGFFVLMNADGYKAMCPQGANGLAPVGSRTVVHTLVAYRTQGIWYGLNVEDPDAVPLELGAELPQRLSRTFQFTYPALVAYQKLIYAGTFSAKDFINGYDYGWLLGITAAGKLEKDLAKIRCE